MSGLAHVLATLGPVGHAPRAPGTWGSLAALPLAWALHVLTGFGGLALATIVVTATGIWAVGSATGKAADPDRSEFVIDEVAGQWLALWPVSMGAAHAGVGVLALWPGWIVAFLAFRLFDIWKPGPVGWADRRKTPVGVMLDDLIAGAMAALVVVLAAAVAHGMMGA